MICTENKSIKGGIVRGTILVKLLTIVDGDISSVTIAVVTFTCLELHSLSIVIICSLIALFLSRVLAAMCSLFYLSIASVTSLAELLNRAIKHRFLKKP